MEQIVEVAVIGVPSEKWGEIGCVVAVLREGQSLSFDDILAHVDGRLAKYKLPGHLHIIKELPRGGTGKVLKFELRKSVPGLLRL